MAYTDYETVVGLEVHAELNTESKIYCSCKNAFGLEVNTQCCPICMGMPGTLPDSQRKGRRVRRQNGLRLKLHHQPRLQTGPEKLLLPRPAQGLSDFSQFDIPLCEHGYVDVLVDGEEKRIGVTRIHIEEDAGKLIHDDSFTGTLVDFNRCGVPLIEIVSEPDISSSAEAKAYLETHAASILQYIGISDCKMQEGSIRCDVNVSVRPKGSEPFGTRVEMKNVNTFSGAVRAIEYEADRQIKALEAGEVISQETRRWDDAKGVNVLLRSKEDAQDYRYFPEPDLSTIVLDEDYLTSIKASIPELPNKKIMRYMKEYSLPEEDATLIVDNMEKSALFASVVGMGKVKPKNASNWILGDVSRVMNETGKSLSELNISAEHLCELIELVEKNVISNSTGKTVFDEMLVFRRSPQKDRRCQRPRPNFRRGGPQSHCGRSCRQ